MEARVRKDFVGQRVRTLRKERALTQSDLAARIGIIQSDLCRMEKGEYRVGLDTLLKVLQVFGMEIGEFFEEGPASRPAEEAELLQRFRNLSPDSRGNVLDYVRFKEQQVLRGDEAADGTA